MKKIAFIFDEAEKFKFLADLSLYPKHLFLGGYEMEEKYEAVIKDPNEQYKEDIFITNNPIHALICIPITKRKILINLNSNHHIQKRRNPIKNFGLTLEYNMFSDIICLSNTQKEGLIKKIGIPEEKIYVIPLGINDELIKLAEKNKKKGNYYISSGGDAGRCFDFKIDKNIPLKIFNNENKIGYLQYCHELVNSKGLVLKIHDNENASDLSGSVTLLEALCAKKPVFINHQEWLLDYPNPNIYVYKNDKELNKLLKQNIKWKKCDLSFYKIERYLKELKKVIYNTE
jgi:hypothetical protein